MCILILRVVVTEMLRVASSSYACREQVSGDHDHRRSRVRGGDRGIRGGDPRVGGGHGAPTD